MSVFFKKIRHLYYLEKKIEIENNRHLYKYLLKNKNLPFYIRRDFFNSYYNNGRKVFYGNFRFRCHFNFKSRSVLSKLSLSRFGLKQLGSRGFLNGFQKASW